MLRKSFPLLDKFIVLLLICIISCNKQKREGPSSNQQLIKDFEFSLAYQKDTVILFSDTECYRIFFQNSTGESRCANLDCSNCGNFAGQSGVKLKIYNAYGDSAMLQPFVNGCILELPDSLIVMDPLQNWNKRFFFSIGLKKIAPYPSSYAIDSINFMDYVATFRIIKTY
jgi:hypothetical protein